MKELHHLFKKNKIWVDNINKSDPEFFDRLAKQQNPDYLWIGCSDSRIPANEIMDLLPGHIFVHRNIANVVAHSDLNCLSVIQYAVEMLKVKHIIVCGHYGCGGVQAAMDDTEYGIIDNWLRHIKDVFRHHENKFKDIPDQQEKLDLLCELNVREQVLNVCNTPTVQQAWKSNQKLTVHGWIFNIKNGYLKDLDMCVSKMDEIPTGYSFL